MKLKELIKRYFQRNSIADQLFYGIMTAAVVSVIIIGLLWTSLETRRFRRQTEEVTEKFIAGRKDLVKNEVTRAIDFINYNRSLTQENMRNRLKSRVDEAYDIANNIYLENRSTKSRAEIEKLIKDAIRPIRFSNGTADIFIYTTQGVSVLISGDKCRENQSYLDYKDDFGNYVVRNEVNLLKKMDQGFLHYYIQSKNNPNDSVLFKSTYIREFMPYGWYIGSKDYLDNFESGLKQRILEYLSKVRFGNDGYFFVNNAEGQALITNGEKHGTPLDIYTAGDTNWVKVFKQQLEVYKSSGSGFIEYNFARLVTDDFEKKISYLGSIKEWEWIIGAGFYKNETDGFIKEEKALLAANLKETIVRILASLLIALILTWMILRWISRMMAHGFLVFNRHFRKASLGEIEINQEALVFSEFRELAESVNMMTDELIAARKSLIKEQSLLRSLIDSSPDFIFFKDMNSTFVGCNKAFASYMGLQESDLIGKNDYDFYPREIADGYHEADRKVAASRIPLRTEEWIINTGGERRLMDTLKVLNYDSAGNPIGIVGISRDVTEKEEMQQKYIEAKEKAEEADRLKTAFLANMSHEIRTPMNSIVGFSSLLAEEDLTPEERVEFIQHINQGSETLLTLINDIIDIAKIEAGQLMVTFEPYNVRDMMDDLYLTHAELLKTRGKEHITLVRELSKLPGGDIILTDPFRLKQVMTNLLVNAVKFTDNGSITYGYRLEGDYLVFYVQDTGIGISDEGKKVIFERFRQENRYGVRHQGGTGLGLAISRHIVQLLGGDISVDSEPGMGALFTFRIPYNPDTGAGLGERGGNSTTFSMNWETSTILVVEDLDVHFNYIRSALLRTGINVERAVSGKESIDFCRNNPDIDVVLMDIKLPDMDGYAATAEIRQFRPNLPVIAQSAYNVAGEELKCIESGCSAYIWKPIKLKQLLEVVGRFVENSGNNGTQAEK